MVGRPEPVAARGRVLSAPEVVVTYSDGREETVKFTSSVIVAIERRWKVGVVPAVESSLFGCWVALHKPGNGRDDDERFDDWLEGVEEAVDKPKDSTDAVPTQPGPEPG